MFKLLVIALIFQTHLAYAQQADNVDRIPRRKAAVIRSIIIPGWGQHFLNEPAAARKYYISEAGLAIGMLVSRSLVDARQRDYRSFAAEKAGADFAEKPDIYYVRIGAYDNINEYNEVMLRNRQLDAVYQLGTGSDWDWNSKVDRLQFKEIRNASQTWAKLSAFLIGGMLLNRVVSAVHVLFLTRTELESTTALMPLPGGGQWTVAISF
jgi:hypothetical protein